MKRLVVFLLLAISFLILANTASAQYGQYGPYQGPEPSLSIMIDKMVGTVVSTKGGESADFVDNLSPSDPRFLPGEEILFKLKVKNTSTSLLKNVTVTDTLPDYVEPVEGLGTFSDETREITINAGDLEVDEQKEFLIKVRLLEQDELPEDVGLFCLVNTARVFNSHVSDEDTSQFCVEKQVLGVSAVPSAGPEMGVLLLTGQLTALGLGLFLKKRFN